MLFGRAMEQARLRTIVAATRDGGGRALVLRGDPGIGKTSLLRWVRDQAAGLTVLTASAVETEASLPFVGLADVLQPVLDLRGELPDGPRMALEAALSLGPPVSPDRFAAYAGAFALLERAALERPVLVLIDDAHLLDAPTAEAVEFIARRLGDLPLGIVAAERLAEGRPLELPPECVLTVGPIDDDAALRLLHDHLEPAVARRLVGAAGGNPLALVELPSTLSSEQRRGSSPLPDPLLPGQVIAGAFRRRLDALGPGVRRAVVVAAVGAEDTAATVLAACEHLGCPADALTRAAEAGVLETGPTQMRFRHPLLRSAALELATRGQVRDAHRALAWALDAQRLQERRAWHLARAATAPDEEIARALEQVAAAAAGRTAYAAGTDALVRAGELTADADERARRLLQAAGMAHMSGRLPLAAGLLERAAAAGPGPGLAAEIDHLRGMVRIYAGPLQEGVRLLFGAAEQAAVHSPERAALMLADASMAWGMAGHPSMGIVASRRALQIAPLRGRGRAKLELAMANSRFFVGQGRLVRAHGDTLRAQADLLDPVSPDAHGLVCAIVVHMYLGSLESAQRIADRAVDRCRDAVALGQLAFFLATRADLAFRTGEWLQGLADAEEAVRIGTEAGQIPIVSYALAVLARLEGASGREADCREHLAASGAMAAAVGGSSALEVWGAHALGLLELSHGRFDATILALQPAWELWTREEVRCPDAVPWRHDLIEAYARAGRMREARQHAREFADEVAGAGGEAMMARLCRCRGFIDPEPERHFQEALALHARQPFPFDVARTHLAYGEHLRRTRRRALAREQLRAALRIFDLLGAAPWADDARRQIEATGGGVDGGPAPRLGSLTARELQVALVVAQGLTNREAALSLLISQKTVEHHLRSVYAKLGLRSRVELVALMAARRRVRP